MVKQCIGRGVHQGQCCQVLGRGEFHLPLSKDVKQEERNQRSTRAADDVEQADERAVVEVAHQQQSSQQRGQGAVAGFEDQHVEQAQEGWQVNQANVGRDLGEREEMAVQQVNDGEGNRQDTDENELHEATTGSFKRGGWSFPGFALALDGERICLLLKGSYPNPKIWGNATWSCVS